MNTNIGKQFVSEYYIVSEALGWTEKSTFNVSYFTQLLLESQQVHFALHYMSSDEIVMSVIAGLLQDYILTAIMHIYSQMVAGFKLRIPHQISLSLMTRCFIIGMYMYGFYIRI